MNVLKKCLATLLTVALVLTAFTFVMPASAATVNENTTIANDSISKDDYANGSSDGNIENAYSSANPGIGWASKWSMSADSYVAPTVDDKVQYAVAQLQKSKTETGTIWQRFLKMNAMPAGSKVYRKLTSPISFSNVNATYEFSVDVLDALSDANAGTRRTFRYFLGDLVTVGYYRRNSGAEIEPHILVGGNETLAGSRLTVGGSANNGEIVTLKVKIELDADGEDTITLTAQEKQNYQLASVWTNDKVSSDVVTVSTKAELSGNVNYIAFGSKDTDTRSLIANVNITKAVSGETREGLELKTIAREDFYTSDGYTSSFTSTESILSSKYPTDGSVTKSGWATNWSASSSEYAKPNDTVVTYSRFASFIRIKNINDTIYRQLTTPIVTTGKDGLYTFEFFTHEGSTAVSGRSGLDYHVGNLFTAGYEWTGDNSVTPYINVGGQKYTNGNLTTYGGYTDAELVSYVVTVNLNSKGNDVITLTAKDRTGTNSAKASNSEAVTVNAIANLTGNIDYIGATLNNTYSKTTSTANQGFGGIVIKGVDITGSSEIIALNKDKMGNGYASAAILENIEDAYAKNELAKIFNRNGIAYDSFEKYASFDTQSVATDNLNGGAGWADATWTTSNDKATVQVGVIPEQTAAPWYKQGNFYSLRNDTQLKIGNGNNVSRTMANAIDLSIDGEYLVRVPFSVEVTGNSQWFYGHNLRVALGDATSDLIVFGSRAVDNTTPASNDGLVNESLPELSIDGGSNYATNAQAAIGARTYVDMLIHIKSLAEGNDTIEMYYTPYGDLLTAKPVLSQSVDSNKVLNKLTLMGGTIEASRILGVDVEAFNATIGNAAKLTDYRSAVSSVTNYAGAKAALSSVPECFVKEFVAKEFYDQHPELVIEDIEFVAGENGLADGSNLSELAFEDGVFARVKAHSNLEEDKIIMTLMRVDYDGETKYVQCVPIVLNKNTPSVKMSTQYTFNQANGWDDSFDNSKLNVKVFLWNTNTLVPIQNVTDFPR